MNTINWKSLNVYDGPTGGLWGTLGDLVENAPANLDDAKIVDGQISEWPGFFLAADGEEPNADTPRVGVDWAGFEQALSAHRGS